MENNQQMDLQYNQKIQLALDSKITQIQACAGSGKTTFLQNLYKQIVKTQKNKQVLYLVFNKANQLEAQERFKNIQEMDLFNNNKIEIRTLNSFLNKQLLDSDIKDLQRKYDTYGLQSFIKQLNTQINYKNLERNLQRFKNNLQVSDITFIKEYIEYQKQKQIKDFEDDFYLFQIYYQQIDFQNFDYIFIDEVQDLSLNQFLIIKKFYNVQNSKLILVGDQNQQIYRFRGSNPKIFQQIDKYKPLKLQLDSTYRYGNNICNLVQSRLGIISKSNTEHNTNIYVIQEEDLQKTIQDLQTKDFAIICQFNSQIVYYKAILNIDQKYFLTIHKSKGLEFNTVFFLDQIKQFKGCEKKNNLSYIGYTRAKHNLYLFD